MDAVFACPKCGYELRSEGLVAGREVRCDWCESWVEVPFLPRVAPLPRKRKRSRRAPRWLLAAWAAVGVLAALVLVTAAGKWMHARANLIHEHRMNGLLRSAEADEKAGRLGEAVSELEAALALLRGIEPASSPRVAELCARRDELVRREVRARLDALDKAAPDDVVGECLTLCARVEGLPALADLKDAIRGRLQLAAEQSASRDLAAAREAMDADRAAVAQVRCEHLARMLVHVEGPSHRRIEQQARDLVTRIADRGGAVIEPVTGQFTFGAPAPYTTALQPMLVEVLHKHGYLTCPDRSPWRSVWEAAAPFRISVVIKEQWSDDYMNSRNRTSLLNATIRLKRQDSTVWEQLATARTQVPLPRITGYQAARIGVGDAPVREYERVLYDNARALFQDRFGGTLATIPERSKCSTATAPPSSVNDSVPRSGTS